jgi:hypothetical protein
VEVSLPIWGHPILGTRNGLIERVMLWRSQGGTLEISPTGVVEEPVLVGLIAVKYPMPGFGHVATRVLGRRCVAAADVAALGAAAKVEPPTLGCKTLNTARAAGRYRRIDQDLVRHRSSLSNRGPTGELAPEFSIHAFQHIEEPSEVGRNEDFVRWRVSVSPNRERQTVRIEPLERMTVKARKTAVTALLILALVAACGNDDNPTGNPDSGSGGNTPTTADSGYN